MWVLWFDGGQERWILYASACVWWLNQPVSPLCRALMVPLGTDVTHCLGAFKIEPRRFLIQLDRSDALVLLVCGGTHLSAGHELVG